MPLGHKWTKILPLTAQSRLDLPEEFRVQSETHPHKQIKYLENHNEIAYRETIIVLSGSIIATLS